jgi:hypothetical protein
MSTHVPRINEATAIAALVVFLDFGRCEGSGTDERGTTSLARLSRTADSRPVRSRNTGNGRPRHRPPAAASRWSTSMA